MSEIPPEVKTRVRILNSLQERCEAIGWYTQHLALEETPEGKELFIRSRDREFRNFAMELTFLLREMPALRRILKGSLFVEGDISKNVEAVPVSLVLETDEEPTLDYEEIRRRLLEDN